MRTSALFGAKTPDFSKFMMCPHGQGERGLEPVRKFSDKGRGQFFKIFCGRPLRTAPHSGGRLPSTTPLEFNITIYRNYQHTKWISKPRCSWMSSVQCRKFNI